MTTKQELQPVLIRSNWRHYFEDHHEGLGTTYERFILHRFFIELEARFALKSVLEAPLFGMTGVSGINSLWWAHHGIPVTLLDDHEERIRLVRDLWRNNGYDVEVVGVPSFRSLPFEDRTFDLSWNFAALWFVPELEPFLRELCRLTRKVIMICIPNPWGIGHMLRFAGKKAQCAGLYLDNLRPEVIIDTMERLGWRRLKQAYFDVPPWPDIAMKKEDLLKRVGFGRSSPSQPCKPAECLCILDYYNGTKPDMESDVLKLAFLENAPEFVQRFWAHHICLQFVTASEGDRS